MEKKSKESVNLREGKLNHRCGVCMNYRVPLSCVVVEGDDIQPDQVCDLLNVTSMTVEE